MPASAGPSGHPMQQVRERVELTGQHLGAVSDTIRLSWQRSVAAGLIPDQVHAPYDPDVDAEGRLRWAAAPAMTAVSLDLPDLTAALLLTDRRGQILARWSATAAAADLMDGIGGAPGYVCSETAVGTNSIGLALVTRRPAVVRGFEHYADRLTGFAGISRAVIHPVTAQLVGAVTLVCPDRQYSPAMRALIGRITHETRQRLTPDGLAGDARLREAFLDARRRAKGPMAAVDARTLLVNPAAAGLLGPDPDRAAVWHRAQGAFAGEDTGAAAGEHDARYEPIYDGTTLVGALVRWAPDARVGARAAAPAPASLHPSRWATLTASERSVAEHISRGLTNRETATLLYVSPHTVDYHLRQVFRKLEVHSRVELARQAPSDRR